MHTLLCEGKKVLSCHLQQHGKGDRRGNNIAKQKKTHPQAKPTWPSFPPVFLPPFLRLQPDLTTLMKVYLNSLERLSTVWLLSCSRVPLCWSTHTKAREGVDSVERICLPLSPRGRKEGVQTDGWGLLRGVCHSYSLSLAFLFLPPTFSHSRHVRRVMRQSILVLKNQWRLVTIWLFRISIKILKHIFLVPVFSHVLC